MSDNSAIEWTDATWNPIRARNRVTGKVGWFCTHASDGCRNCYAETFNRRLGTGVDYKAQLAAQVEIYVDAEALTQPMRWKRPRKIFVGSMTDLFADFVTDEMLDQVFAIMALSPQHTFQVLTKRPGRMRDYISTATLTRWAAACVPGKLPISQNDVLRWFGLVQQFNYDPPVPTLPLPNVWLGVSAEDQAAASDRIPLLLTTPAAGHFLSAEPLLGPIDLTNVWPGIEARMDALTGEARHLLGMAQTAAPLRWVIVGGESGPGARPMHPDWARQIRDDCAEAGVPFFFKQWGVWAPVCALSEEQIDSCYRPAPQRDPEASRRCKVDHLVLHRNGDTPDRHGPLAYAAGSGAMMMMAVGKRIAGRQLDSVEYNDSPWN